MRQPELLFHWSTMPHSTPSSPANYDLTPFYPPRPATVTASEFASYETPRYTENPIAPFLSHPRTIEMERTHARLQTRIFEQLEADPMGPGYCPYRVPNIEQCDACRIPLPTLALENSTKRYKIYRVAFHSNLPDDFYKLFLATGSDTYPFRGLYIYVSSPLQEGMDYHEHVGNDPFTIPGYISHTLMGSIEGKDVNKLTNLCRRLLPPKGEIEMPGEDCLWEPLYRSLDWVDDAILLGNRAEFIEFDPSFE